MIKFGPGEMERAAQRSGKPHHEDLLKVEARRAVPLPLVHPRHRVEDQRNLEVNGVFNYFICWMGQQNFVNHSDRRCILLRRSLLAYAAEEVTRLYF